jgi:acyl carrier protein
MTKPTPDEIRKAVSEILSEIAPEADLSSLRPDRPFHDQIEIDSMDFLNFVIGLHERFRAPIPESDYRHLMTLEGCIGYLTREGRSPSSPS